MYNRTAAFGVGSVAVDLYAPVTAGDKIKLQARRISGTNTIIIPADGAGLKLKVV